MRTKSKLCDNPRCGSPMLRTYIRPAMEDHKQRLAPVGWYCVLCHNFKHEEYVGANL